MSEAGRLSGIRVTPALVFEIIRRRLGIIILAPLIVLGVTIPTLWYIPKHYKAAIRILVTDPVLANNTTVENPLLRRDMESSVKLANAKTFILSEAFMTEALAKVVARNEVVKFGKWTGSPSALKDSTAVVTDTTSLQITVDTPNAPFSIKLAKAMGEQYKEWVAKVEVNPTGDSAKAIQERIDLANQDIKLLQQQLEVYKRNNRETLPDQASNYLLQKENYKGLVVSSSVELEKLKTEADSLQLRLQTDPALKVDPESPGSKKIQDLKAELAQMQATHRDTHQDVIKLKAQIAELENSLASSGQVNGASITTAFRTVDTKLKEARAQIASLQKTIPAYQAEVDRLTAILAKMPASEQKINELTFQLTSKEETLRKLNQELAGAQLSARILEDVEGAKFITADSPDTATVEPNAKLLIAAAAAGGVILGLFLALLFEFIDPVIHRIDQLEAQTGMPALAVIPARALTE